MSNDAFQNALAKRNALKKEIEEIDQFLALYQKFDSANPIQNVMPKPAETGQKQTDLNGAAHKRRGTKKLKPTALKDLARVAILEAGQPLTRGKIVEALEAKGYSIPSKDKSQHVGTVLWRYKDEIPNITGRGYWPKDKPVPESDEPAN